MENSGGIQASLSGRYATALFDLAREATAIDAVSASLDTIAQALSGAWEAFLLATQSWSSGREE